MSIEVLSVSPVESGPKDLVKGRIRAHLADDRGSLTIQGWVIGRKSRAVAVEVMQGDTVVAKTDVNLKRPEIAEKFSDVSEAGTSGFQLTLEPEQQGETELMARAILEDGTAAPIESVRVRASRRGLLRRLMS